MSSASPSPNSSPAAVSPASSSSSPPPPTSTSSTSSPPPDTSTTSPPPTSSQPNGTSDPPASTTPPSTNSTSPPTQSPPPATPTPVSNPPPSPVSNPPPSPVSNPPPSPVSNPPPSPVSNPSPSPPPPDTVAPTSPPSVPSPPPSQPAAQPPPSPPPPTPVADVPSPAPPTLSPSTPTPDTSPPPTSESPSTASPPPPSKVSPPPSSSTSPPPPAKSSPPSPSTSPPPPVADPPKTPPSLPPPPPSATPPTEPVSPPSPNSPSIKLSPSPSQPNSTTPSPSPPVSPPLSPPPTQNNSSSGGSTPTDGSNSPIPSVAGNDNSTGNKGITTGATVAIGIVVGLLVLSLIGVALWYVRRRKKKISGYNAGHVMPSPLGSSPMSDTYQSKMHSSAPLIGNASSSGSIYSPPEPGGLGNSRSWFTYEELIEATNGFSVQNLLGEGGFGCVYKGYLSDGREVAVKQLKIGGSQGEREFRAEVETISRVHHRHLVSLVGYCISDHQRLLVYDYVANNTLHFHLHGEGRPVMDWAVRVKVAAGAARGIAYLHEDCHPRIIHRDIKSSNILLDNNFEAQVSDFGLAKLALDAYTHVTTRVMGTFGYMAPEYASSGKLTEKSDVYSFGVVLLELITGRRPVDTSQPLGDESLVEWARPFLIHALDNQEFDDLVDPILEKNYVEREMFRMIEAAAACVRHSAVKRPRMGQVVRALESIGDSSDLSNGMKPGQSEVFDSAQQSAEIRMFRRMAFGSQDYSSEMFSMSQNSWKG